jgi:hypothetical protein
MFSCSAQRLTIRACSVQRALGFSTPMTLTSYYYPCTGAYKDKPECQTNPCHTPCPFEK